MLQLRSENSEQLRAYCTQASTTPTDPAQAESPQFRFFYPQAASRVPQGSTTADLQRDVEREKERERTKRERKNNTAKLRSQVSEEAHSKSP